MDSSKFLIVGANGQLGTALCELYPDARAVTSKELDIADTSAVEAFDWKGVTTILNAAGYTKVDEAETPAGRAKAWQVNATGAHNLAAAALEHDLTLVHISTDYVFNGQTKLHDEDEPVSPLGVYGQSKAAGDIAARLVPKHYIIRTSWVMGSGGNFVRSMFGLAIKDVSPNVVADQYGRPSFTAELARSIDHLLRTNAPFGTYNASGSGDIVSWADIARKVYEYAGRHDLKVGDTTAAEYFAGKVSSPRPVHSGLDLSKLEATGFKPRDWQDSLAEYVEKLKGETA